MKRAPFVTLIVAISCCAPCYPQIGKFGLESCRAAEIGRSTSAAVLALVNGSLAEPLESSELMEFRWVDLAGDGRCELLFTRWGATVTRLYIEWPDSAQVLAGETNLVTKTLPGNWTSKITGTSWRGDHNRAGFLATGRVRGEKILPSSIRDLNGDGKMEIITDSYLVWGRGRATVPTPEWPQVYQLQGEKYVPASQDFPEFYDNEILPDLNNKIAETLPGEETTIAALQMERDKIQRVLGRDPNAGLGKARNWARSENPDMIENAIAVFRDIPGHEAEAKAAEQAWKQALQRHHPMPIPK